MISIIQRPLLSEKSMTQASRGWYAFVVSRFSRKTAIATSVSTLYHVNVLEVRTMVMHGKARKVGKKMKTIVRSDWKKALVRLKAGQTIPIFEVTDTQNTDK